MITATRPRTTRRPSGARKSNGRMQETGSLDSDDPRTRDAPGHWSQIEMEPGWILLFLHLLGGAAWLGASIFANVVVVPYIGRRPPGERPALVSSLIIGPERLVIGSALLAGTTGLLLGASSGRIAGLDNLDTPFGTLWFASIAVALAVFATGGPRHQSSRGRPRARPDHGRGRRSGVGRRGCAPATQGRVRRGTGRDRLDPGPDGRAEPIVGSGRPASGVRLLRYPYLSRRAFAS